MPRITSPDRTELRLRLRRLYLKQSAYYQEHRSRSEEIESDITETRRQLKAEDASSIHPDPPKKKSFKRKKKAKK
ncbi:hypothetical protein PSTEL_09535 [Paenibacillus stellifer]|uniref:Uncharacterized protein n=1 Tax=Paenibacillus stellifer TaxID=169760 RepID=A0A089LT66_9BACL|nr:hypothetical protein PSTEL_09535 [Paenibacillus stellifer]